MNEGVLLLRHLPLLLLLLWPVHNLVLAVVGMLTTRPVAASAGGWHTKAPRARFWLIVPALNEEAVIEQTVKAALLLDTTTTPARVLVVDDASDDATPVVLAGIDDDRLVVIRRELPEARRGKGEALNAAYRFIRAQTPFDQLDATVVGIIDGDGRLRPGALRTIAEFFADPRTAAVQCQVRIHNRQRLLGLLQDIEFGCIAHAAQSVRHHIGSVGLGGNGQFTRVSALARFERPWSSCLVEDLELGLRMHLTGLQVRYAGGVAVTQQGLVDPGRLLRQRTRWAQGNLQCGRYLGGLARSREVGSIALVDLLQYLLAPWAIVPLSVLVLVVATLTLVALGGGHSLPGLVAARSDTTVALAWWAAILVFPGLMWAGVYWFRYRDAGSVRTVLAGLLYPAFLLLGVLATWRALYRHLRRRNAWAKTERSREITSGSTTVVVALPSATVVEDRAAAETSTPESADLARPQSLR